MKKYLCSILLICSLSGCVTDDTQSTVGSFGNTQTTTETILNEPTEAELKSDILVELVQPTQAEIATKKEGVSVVTLPPNTKVRLLEPTNAVVPKGTRIIETKFDWFLWLGYFIVISIIGVVAIRTFKKK